MRTPGDPEMDLGEECLRAALAPPVNCLPSQDQRLELAFAAGRSAGMVAGQARAWKNALALSVPALLVGLGLGWGIQSTGTPVPVEKVIYYGALEEPCPSKELTAGGVWMARSKPGVIEEPSEFSPHQMAHPGKPWSVGYIRQHLESLEEDKQ